MAGLASFASLTDDFTAGVYLDFLKRLCRRGREI